MSGYILIVYSVVRQIAVILAALSVAVLAVKYLTGSAQEDSRIFGMLRLMAIALIAIYMLGPLIGIGKKVAQNYIWDPDKPGIINASSELFESKSETPASSSKTPNP